MARLDANTLDSGGVALTGNTLGTELITIRASRARAGDRSTNNDR
jgi:hypothetical protein